jgi:cytochrome c551/c552
MKTKEILLSMIALMTLSGLYATPGSDGKTIFTSRCAGCHNVTKILTGPALAGIDQRRSIDWIINFVHSSHAVVKSGDPYAVALFEKFNKIQMPDHPDLTPDNIRGIVEYIKSEATLQNTKATFPKSVRPVTGYKPLSLSKDYLLISGYLLVVSTLIGILLLAVYVKDYQRKWGTPNA